MESLFRHYLSNTSSRSTVGKSISKYPLYDLPERQIDPLADLNQGARCVFLGWLAGADFESDASSVRHVADAASVRLSAKEQETNTQS